MRGLTAQDRCSTPNGIKGIGTILPIPNGGREYRAQRLMASKELEQGQIWIDYAIPLKCSTPNGIKGIGTKLNLRA